MTTKQYIGLLALICVVASPFVANQWLRFTKAQHSYQTQLAKEKQQSKLADRWATAPDEEKRKVLIEAEAEDGLTPANLREC